MMSAYNVRSAALDMTMVRADVFACHDRGTRTDLARVKAFTETLGGTGFAALQSAFEQAVQKAEQRKAAGDEDWWKFCDSSLAVVGTVSEDLIEHVQECQEEGKKSRFGLEAVFEGVVMRSVNGSGEFEELNRALPLC